MALSFVRNESGLAQGPDIHPTLEHDVSGCNKDGSEDDSVEEYNEGDLNSLLLSDKATRTDDIY